MADIEVPVLIVGGGGAGLSSSMLLSKLGITSYLISSLPHTSLLPKAHVLHPRVMEIFSEMGVAGDIYERGTPAKNMAATGWYTGVAGPHDGYGRCLGRLECWGGAGSDPDYTAASYCRTANLPQIRLEPLLKAHAERLGGDIHFGHELIELSQDGEGVTATVRVNETRDEYTVRAAYLLGCDGGRSVGKRVGIEMAGQRNLMRIVTTHFSGDLSPYLQDPEVLIRWLINPDFGGSWASGVLVAMGPERWGTESEEWVYHLQFGFDDTTAFDDGKILERLQVTLGIPDFKPTIHYISRWIMEGVLAETFRAGRVFLLGDAAHRHPPTGGLGLMSAIHDAGNLCWKLAAVLKGQAGDQLLDTYEAERKPVCANNIKNAVGSAMNHFVIDQALNLSADKSPAENWAEVRPLWEDLPQSAEKRHALNKAVGAQTMEFRHQNVEFGYTYNPAASTAVVDDGSPPYVPLDPIRLYEPGTQPGHPLPHAWVEREGERIALGTLAYHGYFLLIAGEDGGDWVAAAERLAAARSLPLRAITVGVTAGDYVDVRCAWLKHRAISSTGAVLVRPDRFIAFRAMAGVPDAYATLSAVLDQVLGVRTPAEPVAAA